MDIDPTERLAGMNSNRQNQSLVIFTLATATLAVVLFQADLRLSIDFFSKLWLSSVQGSKVDLLTFLQGLKLVMVGIVFGHYWAVFVGVVRIIRQTTYVSGRQLADGPLFNLGAQMWFLMPVFVINVLDPLTNSP